MLKSGQVSALLFCSAQHVYRSEIVRFMSQSINPIQPARPMLQSNRYATYAPFAAARLGPFALIKIIRSHVYERRAFVQTIIHSHEPYCNFCGLVEPANLSNLCYDPD